MVESTALISLGSNLGDREAILDGAVVALRTTPGIVVRSVSSYHETEPVGGPLGQGRFLNAAALLETSRSPRELLQALQEIENRFGRVRTVRWGERTLDLDLILFGQDVIDEPDLIVPHPRFSGRRFVLAPLAEIVPDAIDPASGKTITRLLADCQA
jgi:2-amino-4-hydroxy-6-hydroxymethyldihydropteridine diphosphokinase